LGTLKKSWMNVGFRLDEFNSVDIEQRYTDFVQVTEQMKHLQHDINMLQQDLQKKREKLSDLENIEYDPECKYCVELASRFFKEQYSLTTNISDTEGEVDELSKQRGELKERWGELSSVELEYVEYDVLKRGIAGIELEYFKTVATKSATESTVSGLEKTLQDLEYRIKRHYELEKTIKNNEALNAEIAEIKDNILQLDVLIRKTNAEMLDMHGTVSSLKTKRLEIEDKITEASTLEDRSKVYEYYLDAIKRDGVPYELITQIVPAIEGEINNILEQIVDFGMVMEMDGKHINAHIVYEDQFWPLEMCSGMERFISGLAIRVAMINVCNLPRPNVLFIDEGLGSLDPDNLNSMAMLFAYLRTQFDHVVMVSHLDIARDWVDDIIEISTDGGFSKVVYEK
jgi:DNA repair protein SbcC/Rad50